MSLFRARDWWTTNAGSDETFGPTSLVIANIDNSRDNSDKIITGSYEGILRIYSTANTIDDKTLKPFQANDLLLEIDLRQPILQLASGLLLSASKSLNLAVLHPKKISIYSAAATIGVTEYGSSYNVLLMYEHNLPQSAYNFTIGPFGQIKGRDFICVQSTDGTLSFYEQESFAFSRHLTNFMLPGPFVYLPTTDSFVVSNGSWHLESFRYQVLAISKTNETKSLNDPENNLHGLPWSPSPTPSSASSTAIVPTSSSSGRRITPDWSLMISEPLLDLQAHTLDKKVSLIVALGERNLYLIRDSGTISWMKKLNFTPFSLSSYLNQSGDGVIILVASENGNLLIYSGNCLRWSSQLPFPPIALARASFPNVHGALITLSPSGELAAAYLGTCPSASLSSTGSRPDDQESNPNDVNYAGTETELSELRKIIATFNANPSSLPMMGGATGPSKYGASLSDGDSSDIQVKLGNLVNSLIRSLTGPVVDDLLPMVSVTISLSCINPVSNVRVSIEAAQPIIFEPSLLTYPALAVGQETQLTTLMATLSNLILPVNLSSSILVTYTNASGSPRVYRKPFHLPLSLICRLQSASSSTTPSAPPQSTSSLTYRDPLFPQFIEVNFTVQGSIDLRSIFSDLTTTSISGQPPSPPLSSPSLISSGDSYSNNESNNLSISFYVDSGSIVTIIGGIKIKDSLNKIKIRSENLQSISLITNELIRRCKSNEIRLETVSYDRTSLPLEPYLNCLERRFNLRLQIKDLSSTLAIKSSYFRAVQKRLLIKFKDRNPTPLSNLDILLDEIHSKILSLTNQLVSSQIEFERLTNQLASSTELIHNLLEIVGKMKSDEVKLMKSLWSSSIRPDADEGWEERVELALSSEISNGFNRPSKDQLSTDSRFTNSVFEMSPDCGNLKTLITNYIDQILSCGSTTTISNPVVPKSPRDGSASSFMMPSSVAEVINEIDDDEP